MDNLYALEPLLLTHLRATCASVQFIAGVVDPAAIRAAAQFVNERPNPVAGANGAGSARFGGVFVCPAADFNDIENSVTSTEGACDVTMQRWLVLIATKNQRKFEQANNDEPCDSRMDNGLLCAEVIPALAAFRWSPTEWPQARPRLPLRRAPTGLPSNVFPDENGLYITATAWRTEQP